MIDKTNAVFHWLVTGRTACSNFAIRALRKPKRSRFPCNSKIAEAISGKSSQEPTAGGNFGSAVGEASGAVGDGAGEVASTCGGVGVLTASGVGIVVSVGAGVGIGVATIVVGALEGVSAGVFAGAAWSGDLEHAQMEIIEISARNFFIKVPFGVERDRNHSKSRGQGRRPALRSQSAGIARMLCIRAG